MTNISETKWKYLTQYNMENWGYLLERPYIQIELTTRDMDAIITNKYGEGSRVILYDLQNALKNTNLCGNKWFGRLSTRSMKDAFYAMTPIPLTNYIEIIERLCDSKRVYDDVVLSRKYNTPLFLFLTRWDEKMNVRHEFRCFVKNNQLIGISQYDLYLDLDYMECDLHKLTHNIRSYINNIQYDEQYYVADVLVDEKNNCSLIEINPYDKTTSAIHFTWRELDSLYIRGRLTMKYKLFDNIKDYNMKITEY